MMFSTPITRKHRRPSATNNATALHEANFAKLARVIPCLNDLDESLRILQHNNIRLEVRLLETSKYTKTFTLSLQQSPDHHWLNTIDLKIRNYFDARVTEVLAFQHHHRLAVRYPYPNPNMFQRNEKWQTDKFLSEWLDHCLRTRSFFRDQAQPTNQD